jgi:hypothetical protein
MSIKILKKYIQICIILNIDPTPEGLKMLSKVLI